MYEFKKEYVTGIEAIDSEHQRLFEIADEAYELQHNEMLFDKYDQLKALLGELRDYTKTHFAHEEAYMEQIGYKRMFTQKMQHQAFINKLDDFNLADLDENSDKIIDDVLVFLTDWLVDHILNNDVLIGK